MCKIVLKKKVKLLQENIFYNLEIKKNRGQCRKLIFAKDWRNMISKKLGWQGKQVMFTIQALSEQENCKTNWFLWHWRLKWPRDFNTFFIFSLFYASLIF